ncbi:MAG: hypothetical protein C3F11_14910 [Methylocystaceae bacterium]|nr:MAG: hypothetical protein C3F11_14910 [Methylocystaceae bacterium]
MKSNGKISSRLAAVHNRLSRRGGPEATVGDIVDSAGAAGHELALAALTLLSLIPGPSTLVLGPLILIVAFQAVTGAKRLRLPEFLRRRRLRSDLVLAGLAKGVAGVRRIEDWLGPRRLLPLTSLAARAMLALPFLVMAAVLTIPIPVPLANLAPAASLVVLTFGLVSRDGLAILLGWISSVATLAWTAAIFWRGARFLDWILDRAVSN